MRTPRPRHAPRRPRRSGAPRTLLAAVLAVPVLALLAGPVAATIAADATDDDPTEQDPTDDPGAEPDHATDPAPELRSAPLTPLPIRASVRAVGDVAPPLALRGGGWGHGVGMSQHGAYAMAQAGWDAAAITGHYYPGTQVEQRTSDVRIRVGMGINRTDTQLTALDEVTWWACQPAQEPAVTRVPMDRCEPWFTQPPGTRIRALPHQGGVRVERQVGGGWEPWHTTPRPVARADHGAGAITAPSSSGQVRTYRFGWRDLHNLGGRFSIVHDLVSVERYLRGLAEVPSSWGIDGPAALDAQALTGRTFALQRVAFPRGGQCACDLLDTVADQVFVGEDKVLASEGQRWAAAVERTAGQVVTYQGTLAQTFYSSSHGGRSENIEDSWAYGTTPVPYLRSVDDPWSSDPRARNPRASWTATVPNAAFAAFVSEGQAVTLTRVDRVAVLDTTDGGTPVALGITGRDASGRTHEVVFTGRPGDPKPIAGASLRRFLPVTDGGTGGRLNSSQLTAISFAPFLDVDGHPEVLAISWAHAAGVVRGVDETTFDPDRPVNRAQLASFLVNTFDVPTPDPTGRFSDVAPDHPHARTIEALTRAGVISGYPDGTYRPNQTVTRAQTASLVLRAMAWDAQRTDRFADVGSGAHTGAIGALAEREIMPGCAPDRFCPGDEVPRATLAGILRRVVLG